MSALNLDIGAVNPISRSFGLVRKELDSTLGQVENHFAKFAEDQDDTASYQSYVNELSQIRGIFKLIEVPGAEHLTDLMITTSEMLKNSNQDKKDRLILVLGQAVFTLQRYMTLIRKEEKDVPLVLIPVINELRRSQKLSNVYESDIVEFSLPNSLPRVAPLENDLSHALGRLRHMYQIGLLSVLRKSSVMPSLKIMGRALEGIEKALRGHQSWSLWWSAAAMLQVMVDEGYSITSDRKMLLMGIDKELRNLVKLGPEATVLNKELIKPVLYTVSISSSGEATVAKLKSWIGFQPPFTETQLQKYRKHLNGPDHSALASVAISIIEEIAKVKDSIDILSRSDLNVETHITLVRQSLTTISETLGMVQEAKLAEFCRSSLNDFNLYEDLAESDQHKCLVKLAGNLVQMEHEINELKSEDGINTGSHLNSANKMVLDEIQNGIVMAKRSISAFEESGYDKMHLANISSSLDSVRGGITFINEPVAQKVVENSLRFIKERLIPSELKPNLSQLESLADALTSVEYFFETLADTGEPSVDILDVAKESMKQLGLPV